MCKAKKFKAGIINLLIDINHGRLNPNILKPRQVKTELARMKDALQETLVLPGKWTGAEIKEIYTLLTAKGIFVDNKLIFNVKIVLFGGHPSHFFRGISMPVKAKNDVIIADLNSKYLDYNFEIDFYNLMTEASLNRCQKWKTNNVISEGGLGVV